MIVVKCKRSLIDNVSSPGVKFCMTRKNIQSQTVPQVYGATQLLEYCQGFLLQNMVALLTYDDSVKRLLFGKRLPGHNVLSALLGTLQKRIESRKNQAKSR